MKPFFAAIQFLTILPVPAALTGNGRALERSVHFFPVVGLLIGMAAAGFDLAISRLLPPLPASACTVILLVVLSGGLHMDGLADTADGFFSARPREKMLEIMRDSRTGVMGVIAVLAVLILKITLLTAVLPEWRWRFILLMPLAGRSAIVTLMTALPYVRQEGGLATLFNKNRSWLSVLWTWGLMMMAGWWSAREIGLAILIFSVVTAILFALYSSRKIGGFTGDTLGAGCELTEIAPLLVGAICHHAGLTLL